MEIVLLWILGSTIAASLISLIGVITLGLHEKILNKILLWLVGLSAGALMGGAFLHLLPEATEKLGEKTFIYVLIGFVAFFLIERVLHWRHCHHGHCDVHTFTTMNILGDGIHNFIDGLVIAGAFIADIRLGIITTIAILAHELPQEMGDFAVLLHGGFTKAKALLYNFLASLSAIVGALIGYFISSGSDVFVTYLLPFAAGGFIYIAASDLVPELHKEQKLSRSVMSFIFFLIGIGAMVLIKVLFE